MGHKLLLADDSTTIQKVVTIIFSGEEYDLTVVGNGTDALQRARESVPEVMLIDAVMPGKNGFDVCREVRDDPGLSHVPILLLAGVFEHFDEERARESGADDFIVKPFESQVLVDKVTELISKGAARRPAHTPGESSALLHPGEPVFPVIAEAAAPVAEPLVPDTVAHPADADEPLVVEEVTVLDDPWGGGAVPDLSGELRGVEPEDVVSPEGDEEVAPLLIEDDLLPPPVTGTSDGEAELTVAAVEEFVFDVETEEFLAPGDDGDTIVTGEESAEAEEPPAGMTPEPGESVSRPPLEQAEPLSADLPLTPAPSGAPLCPPPSAAAAVDITEEHLVAALSKVSREVIERIVWEVVPDLAETLIREEIRKIREGV